MTHSAPAVPTPHRFTRQEYHCLAESHLLADERIKLLDGVIITMSRPQKAPTRPPFTTSYLRFCLP